jgi:hypothetical protein
MTETAFLKALERLNHMGMLMRLSKGVYCKPRKTRFGAVPAGEHELASYFMGEDNRYGFIAGYRLYNKYGLTTQISKQVEIYSRKSHVARGTIKNIHLRKLKSFYRPEMLPMIEFLEILENYQKIEDLNQRRFLTYCNMAVKKFNENTAAAWDIIEYEICHGDVNLLPYSDEEIKKTMTDLQYRLFKTCDYLDLWIFCKNEQALGNTSKKLLTCITNCEQLLEKYTDGWKLFKSVQKFMNQYEP